MVYLLCYFVITFYGMRIGCVHQLLRNFRLTHIQTSICNAELGVERAFVDHYLLAVLTTVCFYISSISQPNISLFTCKKSRFSVGRIPFQRKSQIGLVNISFFHFLAAVWTIHANTLLCQIPVRLTELYSHNRQKASGRVPRPKGGETPSTLTHGRQHRRNR